ncbi:hypothetical protein OSB04_025319 [Centaurea solstitialis]|uniref:Uncharacterized protein n=1 Tax=Centaurea solstitialis TaxID=347529 RepID=A0AA38W3X3_9ASTR|nr:hypothetical protein OSB04_025319 [Centaurea solstitialis]
MVRTTTTKGTTPKALQFQLQFKMKKKQEAQGTTTNGNGSSGVLLYYGDASAGSVPFMWESHPGTPKHAPTQSPLPRPPPTLTPPPATASLRTLFLASSFRKQQPHVEAKAAPSSYSSVSSYDSPTSNQSRTSLRSLFLASSSRKLAHVAAEPLPSSMEIWRRRKHVGGGGGGGGGGSPTWWCFGGGGLNLMKVCRIKKLRNALMAIGGHHGVYEYTGWIRKEKFEFMEMFKTFKAEVENQLDQKIKVVRSDRGGEYYIRHMNVGQAPRPFFEFCEDNGIINQYTMNTP